jgi:hypothetical protein
MGWMRPDDIPPEICGYDERGFARSCGRRAEHGGPHGLWIRWNQIDQGVDFEAVDHPAHYGGADNPYEAIKVIEAWELGFCLGNTVKYIARAGKKTDKLEDLKKARWYLDREISQAEKGLAMLEGLERAVDQLARP